MGVWQKNKPKKSLKRCSTSHHEPDNFSSNQNRQKDGKSHVIFVPKLEFPCLICGQLKACGQQMQFLADHLIPINRLLALSFIWQIANNRVILALKLTLERSIRASGIICLSLVKRLILCFNDNNWFSVLPKSIIYYYR